MFSEIVCKENQLIWLQFIATLNGGWKNVGCHFMSLANCQRVSKRVFFSISDFNLVCEQAEMSLQNQSVLHPPGKPEIYPTMSLTLKG